MVFSWAIRGIVIEKATRHVEGSDIQAVTEKSVKKNPPKNTGFNN